MKLYQWIARMLDSLEKNESRGSDLIISNRCTDALNDLEKFLPSGSGFNSGCKILLISKPNRIVVKADFQHMCEHGYTGWTDHLVIVTPSLVYGMQIRVTGKDKNEIKDYIGETMEIALNTEIANVFKDAAHHFTVAKEKVSA